jgi:hypothetical protein
VCIVVCDGLTGLPDAAIAVKQQALVRYASFICYATLLSDGVSLRHTFAITFEGRSPRPATNRCHGQIRLQSDSRRANRVQRNCAVVPVGVEVTVGVSHNARISGSPWPRCRGWCEGGVCQVPWSVTVTVNVRVLGRYDADTSIVPRSVRPL